MKTSVEIAEDLRIRAKKLTKEQPIPQQSSIEEASATILVPPSIRPITFKGNGLSPEFKGASWDKIREAIYG
jgi:hypothetical protein